MAHELFKACEEGNAGLIEDLINEGHVSALPLGPRTCHTLHHWQQPHRPPSVARSAWPYVAARLF